MNEELFLVLNDAKDEIVSLRRKNELLEAQMRVFNIMAGLSNYNQEFGLDKFDILDDINRLIINYENTNIPVADNEILYPTDDKEVTYPTAEIQWTEPANTTAVEGRYIKVPDYISPLETVLAAPRENSIQILADHLSGNNDGIEPLEYKPKVFTDEDYIDNVVKYADERIDSGAFKKPIKAVSDDILAIKSKVVKQHDDKLLNTPVGELTEDQVKEYLTKKYSKKFDAA